MSFGRLIYEPVKETAARHFEPAPIAIHAMHRPTLRKVFFAIENAFSRRQRVQLKIKILSARTDNRCPF
jgi:hypothetical protein